MKTLNQDAINKISGGQVITCVVDAIKELVENSLDAGAKTIRIKIEDQGLKLISVTDDGSGITEEGRDTCGQAYTTSKIIHFEDLMSELTTYGFRGEAIHSLCVVGDVTIITRVKGEKTAKKMVFNHNGDIKQKTEVTAPVGTTVIVENILSCFPVRVREERASFSADNLKNLLSRYYLAAPTVRFMVDAAPYVTATRPPLANLVQAVKYEFGSQVASCLVERSAETYVGDIRVRIKAVVPTMNCDWKIASTSRMQPKQLLLVNGRPVKNSNIEKRINEEYWKKYGSLPKRLARYVVCIDFFRETQMCSSMFDINKDPAKSHILFSESNTILKLLDEIFEFEKTQKLKFRPIKQWPSKSVHFDQSDVEISSLGGCTWKDAGMFGEMSLFHVKNYQNVNYLISVDTKDFFEKCGANRIEVGRTEQSELIVNFWDQLVEQNSVKKCIFVLGVFN
ncbi:ATPase [Tritrichomonas foetus]|uniref:ATPase n=1 Tax=Tritrichomonas foetus TaxID=1144522 RepID=A0A1J4JZN7_9EUKA|nr:ATPase [Tritrichomonas foetus]|eukprot:OHT04625.1 ATPase [Tritrichomonas foetus]